MRLRSHHVAEVFFFIRDEVVEKGSCTYDYLDIAHRLGMESRITYMAIQYLIKNNAIKDLTVETLKYKDRKDLTETGWIRDTKPPYTLGHDLSFLEKMEVELDKYKDDGRFYEIPFVIDYIKKDVKIFLFLFKKWKYKKNWEEWIYYTYEDIMKVTNVDYNTVSLSLREMVKLGILEIKKEEGKSNGYRFIEKNFNNYKRME